MKDLDVLVLADRNSSVARTYLTYLKAYGYKPREILLVDFIGKSKKNKILTRLLGSYLTRKLIAWYRENLGFRNRKNAGWMRIAEAMNLRFDVPVKFFGAFDYAGYGSCVEYIVVTGIDSSALLAAVKKSRSRTVVFTGGGIVKPEFLKLPSLKVIHIHPGIVPDVKGADGILWSALLRGKLGYSGIYMNPGIDTGEVLIRREYELPQFDASEVVGSSTLDDLYKALLYCFDAHMRAITLIELIKETEADNLSLGEIAGDYQTEGEGRTYFFMHPKLKGVALKTMLK